MTYDPIEGDPSRPTKEFRGLGPLLEQKENPMKCDLCGKGETEEPVHFYKGNIYHAKCCPECNSTERESDERQ